MTSFEVPELTEETIFTWGAPPLKFGAGPASAVELMAALHPTPAVCGSPRAAALALIALSPACTTLSASIASEGAVHTAVDRTRLRPRG